MARPKVRISKKMLQNFDLEKNPWEFVIENELWVNFDRMCKFAGFHYAEAKGHRYFSKKLLNRLNSRIRSHVSDYIAQNINIYKLIDYTALDLANHLTDNFPDGLDWSNEKDWHIDHIKPKAKMKFKNIGDEIFTEAMSLKNLRPLCKKENLKKGSKWEDQLKK